MTVWHRLTATLMLLGFCGCTMAELKDVPKTIWGSSTRVLEQARANAITKTYDRGYWDCFKAAEKVVKRQGYVLFQKDEVRGFMVVMGIPGAVDTTEVGVFFVDLNDHQTRMELSSLSTNAKRLLAKDLFHGMNIALGLAPPDKETNFLKGEFNNFITPEALVAVIQQDGFSVPSTGSGSAIDSLNTFLGNRKFYDEWKVKRGKNVNLPKKAKDLININNKNDDQIRALNRLILEATYPANCPKQQEQKPVQGGSVQKQ